MQKRVFITGISGFAGNYLAKQLLELQDFEVYGSVFGSTQVDDRIPASHYYSINLLDAEATKKAMIEVKPEWVFHLAALTVPAESFNNPAETITNNITAQLNVLEALRTTENVERILVVGSAEEYGLVSPDNNPVNEDTPLKPTSPYAVSKIAQDFLGYQYFQTYKLPIIRVRPFNHTGAGQAPVFVVSSFAKQIAEIEATGKAGVLRVGNLESTRDFTDVRDMMAAYILAMQKGVPGDVYNLGSGRGVKIKNLVDQLIQLARVPITIEVDPSRLRPSDTSELVCNAARFNELTGWKAEISLEETLISVLDYWRNQLKI